MSGGPTRALRILVAEDDHDMAITLMMLLGEDGHEARAVHSGRNVIGSVADFDPDVVLLDIGLPGLTGWEVARTLSQRRRDARPLLIGISGQYRKSADRILAGMLGFDHYLLKPFDPTELLTLVSRAKV
jgi:two-component system OmpR family response regulator